MPRVAIHVMGCKANFAEGRALIRYFQQRGWEETSPDQADVIIVHSCAVTKEAERETLYWLRRMHRTNPRARLILTGCYTQLPDRKDGVFREAEAMAAIAGERYDPQQIYSLAETLTQVPEQSAQSTAVQEAKHSYAVATTLRSLRAKNPFIPAWSTPDGQRTRVFFKVQDGCDYHCAFCVIPALRGVSRSLPLAEVVHLLKEMVERLKPLEVVLTGINVGDVGKVDGRRQYRLIDLLETLETHEAFSGVRFRLSSVEPNLVTGEVVRFFRWTRRFVPHVHLPLQAGSDAVLKRMRRRYTVTQYRSVVEQLVDAQPRLAIGVDVIAGFPGESVQDFEQSLRLLESLPIAYIHAFPYSERPGTPAARAKGVVPVGERRRRVRQYVILSWEKRYAFARKFVGSVLWALPERQHLLTENYLPVQLTDCALPGANQWYPVQIQEVYPGKPGARAYEVRVLGTLISAGATPRSNA